MGLKIREISWVAGELQASQEGLSSVEVVIKKFTDESVQIPR